MIKQFSVFMSDEAPEEVSKVLASGYIGQGKIVDFFEEDLQYYLDYEYGVTLNSCTSALWLAMHLLGVGPGTAVISTPMTCSATNEVITLLGADIIWADVDEYGNIDPRSVGWEVGFNKDRDIKAILAVDWGGLPCDYDELKSFGIPVIQDAAHAFGASYKTESIAKNGGDFVCFSFQAIKHLTTGDGGLLVTPPEYYERAKLLRWYGLDRTTGLDAMRCRLDITEAGFKFHMNDINAAIGKANLPYMTHILKQHRDNAKYFDMRFEELEILPKWPEDRTSSNWLYTIHVENPDKFEQFMKSGDVPVAVSQVHQRNDVYSCFSKFKKDLPYLDKFYETMTCIPVGWWLMPSERDAIAGKVIEYVKLGA